MRNQRLLCMAIILFFNGQLITMEQEMVTIPQPVTMDLNDALPHQETPRTLADKCNDLGDCGCCMCLSGAIILCDICTQITSTHWSDEVRKKAVDCCGRTRSGRALRDLLDTMLNN